MRKKIYLTTEERRARHNELRREYYERNKEVEIKRNLDRYYKNKNKVEGGEQPFTIEM
jgi:hypothetical protein